MCPFMIYGEVVQRWRLAQGAVLAKWPRGSMEKYGPWFLYALFAGILVWEEVRCGCFLTQRLILVS